jgi:hypothetical protein
MNHALIIASIALTLSSAHAADMPRKHISALTPSEQITAGEMAQAKAIAQACRASDGTILSRAYWTPRLAGVVHRNTFSNVVRQRANIIQAQEYSGPDVALRCDDQLDVLRDRYDEGQSPLCWDDPIGGDACEGIGEMDPFAGLDALLQGY